MVCELLGVQDPSVGMPMDAFVRYITRYRSDNLQSDVQVLRKLAAEEKGAEKMKLEEQLARKKMLLSQRKAAKQRKEAARARMKGSPPPATKTTVAQTPRPPTQPRDGNTTVATQGQISQRHPNRTASQPGPDTELEVEVELEPEPGLTSPALDDECGSPESSAVVSTVVTPLEMMQPLTPSQTDFVSTRSTKSATLPKASSAAIVDVQAARQAKQRQATQPTTLLRSFELTVASADSPNGDGPAGAELFHGLRRVFVRARSVKALLDGETRLFIIYFLCRAERLWANLELTHF